MPIALIVRLLLRLLTGLFIWRVASARRAGGAPPVRGPAPRGRLGTLPNGAVIREGAAIGWRVVSLIAFLAFAVVLTSAGVTLIVLSPQWLGIALAVLAVASLVAAGFDARVLFRLLEARRRRRSQQALRSHVS